MKIWWQYIILCLLIVSCVTLPVSEYKIKKIKSIKFVRTVGSAGSIEGRFIFPTDVVIIETVKDYLERRLDSILVVDSHNNRLQLFDIYFNVITSFGSLGAGVNQFNFPYSVARYTKNYVYISDRLNHRILSYDIKGNFLGILKIKGFEDTYLDEKDTNLLEPAGIDVDSGGNIYIADKGQDRVLKVSPTGYILLIIQSYGFEAKYLSDPTDVAVDNTGKIYIADTGNDCVAIFDNRGNLLKEIKDLKSPQGICVDNEGNIFISDTGNSRVVVYNIKGEFVKEIKYRFNKPTGITISEKRKGERRLYVADTGNHRIVVFVVRYKV